MTLLVRLSRKALVYLFMLVMMLVLPFVFQSSLASPGAPVADFTYLPGTPIVGETVIFNASLSTPNGGTIESYIWSFGDGTPLVVETDPVTKHRYTDERVYSVSLVVVDSEAKMGFTTKNVTVSVPESDLLVFAEAASFARLDDIDPGGWFYQAVLYNPTNESIVVTGLRWWFKSSEKLIDSMRAARCYDSRYFSGLPTASGTAGQVPSWAKWEYPADSVSVTIPAGEIIVTWIEVPTKSNNGGLSMSATYYVEAYDGNRWVSSSLYPTHGGTDDAVSTVFRADFNLTTNPNDENQTHPNPQWLFNEDRTTNPGVTVRVRLIPITSSRGANRIDFATVNITLPSAWSYVSGSDYNPYAETITYFSINGKDRLKWDLTSDVNLYSVNQSMAQNYIEFNVTTPQTPGIYNFTVNTSITSDKGDTAPENQSIYIVVNSPPVASFTYSPEILIANENTTLNASLSYDSDGNIAGYYWDFGDGSNGTGVITTHNYTSVGTYNVTLTVTDNDNLTDTESKLVVVRKYPIAAFTYAPIAPLINQTVTFNASLSTPEGGTITVYQWNFGDGTNVNETDPVTYHNYTILGTYNVILNITDSEGLWDVESKNITIAEHPLASFTYSPGNSIVGETVTFNASLSTPNGGTLVNYFWDFGDGTNTTETDPITYHNFTMIGNYNVTLNVTDSEGLWDTESKIIPIAEFPAASFTYSPLTSLANEPVTFNASLSTPNGGTIVSYHWNFGDGIEITETDPIVYHNYT
ncbi:MAG: PKD domain-containing protein, partial [Candidatus Bathyarchaeota archaeon]